MVDTPARQIPNVGAGYLSGTDPIGEFIVGNVVAGKPLMWLGKGLQYSAAKAGSQWARARVISKTIDKGTPSVEPLPNNVGWGPRQSIHVVHDKNSRITVGDITTENVGTLNGKPVIFDPEAAYNEDIIRMSNTKFKNK